ncbi:hypothetical protein LTR64_008802 [Lithohypha guttulata]|uniref:uncharacterized protein n=1 Tax=Lithohypha guttulata TaxID=1690604 RepID=UPI00315CAD4C
MLRPRTSKHTVRRMREPARIVNEESGLKEDDGYVAPAQYTGAAVVGREISGAAAMVIAGAGIWGIALM